MLVNTLLNKFAEVTKPLGESEKYWPDGYIKTKKKVEERPVNPLCFQEYQRTVKFLEVVLLMWNCLNITLPILYVMLNDKNIKPFSDRFNERLTFLWNMVSMFKQMDTYSAST